MTASRCRGRVVNADAVPVPRARVTIVAATVPMPEIALLTDPDGRFELALPEGRFRLRAHGPRGEVGEAEIECGAAPGDLDLVIGLRRNAESTGR
jgi:Carboxypeptidase regulatory-like domain